MAFSETGSNQFSAPLSRWLCGRRSWINREDTKDTKTRRRKDAKQNKEDLAQNSISLFLSSLRLRVLASLRVPRWFPRTTIHPMAAQAATPRFEIRNLKLETWNMKLDTIGHGPAAFPLRPGL